MSAVVYFAQINNIFLRYSKFTISSWLQPRFLIYFLFRFVREMVLDSRNGP